MSHPFFDSIVYPWARTDAKELYRALSRAITEPAAIQLNFQMAGGEVSELNIHQAPGRVWTQALNLLARASALRQLCEDLLFDQSMKALRPVIEAVVEAAEEKPSEPARPSPETPAPPLESLMQELASEDSELRFLVVRGSDDAGKGRIRNLFARTAQAHGARAIYLYSPIVVTVEDVAHQLFAALDAADAIPPNITTDPAWYQALCLRLQAAASERHMGLWIAVDDLGYDPDGTPRTDPEIRAFFEQFARNLANPAFAQWFRLALMDYPEGPVPAYWPDRMWTEYRLGESRQRRSIGGVEARKRLVAEASAELVEPGMWVGLGTGSTVAYLLPALARRAVPRVRYVATSERTAAAAGALGIAVEPFDAVDRLDLAIDGADQVDPRWWVIKGGGGAHTREKIVAAAAERFVVIVTEEKLVDAIAPPVPLELLSFGLAATLRSLPGATLRANTPVSPDGGVIADYHEPFADPAALAAQLAATPGVVDHGLFGPSMLSRVLVGEDGGVREIKAEDK